MALTKPEVILEAFCGQGVEGTDYKLPPKTSINPLIMTQDNGIPISMKTPLGAGGTPVDWSQTNGYMYLYSSILAWIQFGGTFTFEDTVSAENGGYPSGTVLWSADFGDFVISLMDNNTFNFVTNTSYINDGIHWSTIAFDTYPDINDDLTTHTVTIGGAGGLSVQTGPLVAFYSEHGVQSFIGNVITPEGGFLYEGGRIEAVDEATGNFADTRTNVDTSTSQTQVFMEAGDNGVPTYQLFVYNDQRPEIITASSLEAPGANNVLVGQDISGQYFAPAGSLGTTWNIYAISSSGLFPAQKMSISGLVSVNFTPGDTSITVDLIAAGILLSPASIGTSGVVNSISGSSAYAGPGIQFGPTDIIIPISTGGGSGLMDVYFSIVIVE